MKKTQAAIEATTAEQLDKYLAEVAARDETRRVALKNLGTAMNTAWATAWETVRIKLNEELTILDKALELDKFNPKNK